MNEEIKERIDQAIHEFKTNNPLQTYGLIKHCNKFHRLSKREFSDSIFRFGRDTVTSLFSFESIGVIDELENDFDKKMTHALMNAKNTLSRTFSKNIINILGQYSSTNEDPSSFLTTDTFPIEVFYRWDPDIRLNYGYDYSVINLYIVAELYFFVPFLENPFFGLDHKTK